MNRSAYLTTGLAIKALSRLTKADIVVHGKENLPPGPTIFVMNHFTRIETIILPNYIYELTGKPAFSLAASVLFKGGLEKFFDLVGVVSTADPQRDELIIQSLLAGNSNWIIFPEGSMVKTKKIIDDGKYMIAHPKGMHEPHTGAAALGLRSELYRLQLKARDAQSPGGSNRMLELLGVNSYQDVAQEQISIVPVNLTYYPIRAAENIALDVASKLVKDMPDRVVEELMTEGTMLLSGVDLDIRFGKPIELHRYLSDSWLDSKFTGYNVSPSIKKEMKGTAYNVMQRYMDEIYSLTTLNHEHLFASFLRLYPFKRVLETDFKRRVYYAAALIGDKERGLDVALHKSLKAEQAHLVTDDRYRKYENFIELALEKGVVEKEGGYLIRDPSKLSVPLSLHKGRINNPVEVMANEVEPLDGLQRLIKKIAWQPNTLIKHSVARYLLKKDQQLYDEDSRKYGKLGEGEHDPAGRPYLLHGIRTTGIILVHSYLSLPEELKFLAKSLRRSGFWVYVVRLPGHGTSAEDLATRDYNEWLEALEKAYVIMSSLCRHVVVGGVGVGGNLSLDLAARVPEIKGAFAVCPPYALKNYSTNFMPGRDVWNRILNRLSRGEAQDKYLEFSHGNSLINYVENPVEGIRQLGAYLESIEEQYKKISQPVFIVQADANPVVDPDGSMKLFEEVGSSDKEFCLISSDKHILIAEEPGTRIVRKIVAFAQWL